MHFVHQINVNITDNYQSHVLLIIETGIDQICICQFHYFYYRPSLQTTQHDFESDYPTPSMTPRHLDALIVGFS